MSCLLCDLADGRAERSLVYEDDLAVAIMDLNPVTEGHVLVIPKEHSDGLADLDEELGGHLFGVCMRMAAAVRGADIRCEGVNLFLADGEAAGQEVAHTHLHVLPRYVGDPFRIAREGGWQRAERSELDRVAALLREAVPA